MPLFRRRHRNESRSWSEWPMVKICKDWLLMMPLYHTCLDPLFLALRHQLLHPVQHAPGNIVLGEEG